jgi:hypothetical protein
MPRPVPPGGDDLALLRRFIGLCGADWVERIEMVLGAAARGGLAGRGLVQQHAIALAIARLNQGTGRPVSAAEREIASLAGDLVMLHKRLGGDGRARLEQRLACGLQGDGTLVPLFHLARTAALQRSRGFEVIDAGLDEGAAFDLLIRRDGEAAELACETVSAEEGHGLHRSAWFDLVDGIDPDLQTWLSAHPGRYLLKMTLPKGLPAKAAGDGLSTLAALQGRIREMLSRQARAHQDEAAVLRLDPLLVAGAQAGELGLLDSLRAQFGPEAQLAVTRSGGGMLVMAARAGEENAVAPAVRRRMEQVTPRRFSGDLPGILAMFVDGADRAEWRTLRDGLQLEGETRQFLTQRDAVGLVAVTAASRVELFGGGAPDGAVDGELRCRNQAHPAAKSGALGPAIRSSF